MSEQQTLPLKEPVSAFVEAITTQAAEKTVKELLPQIVKIQAYLDERLPMPIMAWAFYNRDQAARVTGLSETTLITQEKAGNLVADRVESSVRYSGQALIDMMQRQRLEASARSGAEPV